LFLFSLNKKTKHINLYKEEYCLLNSKDYLFAIGDTFKINMNCDKLLNSSSFGGQFKLPVDIRHWSNEEIPYLTDIFKFIVKEIEIY
jgi:hypothetical protein